MSEYNIITGLECCLIAFKNANVYESPVKLDTTRSAVSSMNRDVTYIQTMSGLKQVGNKIIDIDLEFEVFDIPSNILARLDGAILDKNGGYSLVNKYKDVYCAIGIVRTLNNNSREFTYYYNCKAEINSLEYETKTNTSSAPKAYKLTVKCLGDSKLLRYTVRENDIPEGNTFAEDFYKQVYTPK